MRLVVAAVVLAVFAPSGGSAPVPKKPPPPIELTLSSEDSGSDSTFLLVANNTDKPVTWKFTTVPLAAFAIQITDAKGKALEITHPAAEFKAVAEPPSRDYEVPAGGSSLMRFSIASCFPKGERPKGKLTVTATFEHGGKKYQSDPLVVE